MQPADDMDAISDDQRLAISNADRQSPTDFNTQKSFVQPSNLIPNKEMTSPAVSRKRIKFLKLLQKILNE